MRLLKRFSPLAFKPQSYLLNDTFTDLPRNRVAVSSCYFVTWRFSGTYRAQGSPTLTASHTLCDHKNHLPLSISVLGLKSTHANQKP
jgi:hypothetical protein